MKCVTYGTTVLLMIIITFIMGMMYSNNVDYSNPEAARESLQSVVKGGGVMGVIWLGLTLWWLLGITNDCKDGYFLNPRLVKKPAESD